MTPQERIAVALAYEKPAKASKYLKGEEDHAREVVQGSKPAKWIGGGELTPRKVMGDPGKGHRADQAEFRRKQTFLERAEGIAAKEGGDKNIIAAQLAILAKAKTASVDNIGRAV